MQIEENCFSKTKDNKQTREVIVQVARKQKETQIAAKDKDYTKHRDFLSMPKCFLLLLHESLCLGIPNKL